MAGLGIDHRIGVGARSRRRATAAAARRAPRRRRGARRRPGRRSPPAPRPSTGLAAAAGLAGRPRRSSSTTGLRHLGDPACFAIGDCAQHPSGVHRPGRARAGSRRAARWPTLLAGSRARGAADRARRSDVVRLKAHGLDVVDDGRLRRRRARTTRPSGRCGSATPTAAATSRSSSPADVLVGATCSAPGRSPPTWSRRTPGARPVPADPAYLLLGGARAVRPHAATRPRRDARRRHGLPLQRRDQGRHRRVRPRRRRRRSRTSPGDPRHDRLRRLRRRRVRPDSRHQRLTTDADPRGENRLTTGKPMIHSTETAAG